MEESDTVTTKDQVKRPMNAFLIFCKRHRSMVREKNPNLDNRSITRILGEWWANLDPSEKSIYIDLAKQYKDAFMKANPDFRWYSDKFHTTSSAKHVTSATGGGQSNKSTKLHKPDLDHQKIQLSQASDTGIGSDLWTTSVQSTTFKTEKPTMYSEIKRALERSSVATTTDSNATGKIDGSTALLELAQMCSNQIPSRTATTGDPPPVTHGNQLLRQTLANAPSDRSEHEVYQQREIASQVFGSLYNTDKFRKHLLTGSRCAGMTNQTQQGVPAMINSGNGNSTKVSSSTTPDSYLSYIDALIQKAYSSCDASATKPEPVRIISKTVAEPVRIVTNQTNLRSEPVHVTEPVKTEPVNLISKSKKSMATFAEGAMSTPINPEPITTDVAVTAPYRTLDKPIDYSNTSIDDVFLTCNEKLDFTKMETQPADTPVAASVINRTKSDSEACTRYKSGKWKKEMMRRAFSTNLCSTTDVSNKSTIEIEPTSQKLPIINEKIPVTVYETSGESMEITDQSETRINPADDEQSSAVVMDDEDYEEANVRKSKRSNRGRRYMELISQGYIHRPKGERGINIRRSTSIDLEDVPVTAAVMKPVLKRSNSNTSKSPIQTEKPDLPIKKPKQSTIDFDLEAHIAELPACSMDSLTNKKTKTGQRRRTQSETKKPPDDKIEVDINMTETPTKASSAPTTPVETTVKHKLEPITGSQKRKIRRTRIMHLVPHTPNSNFKVPAHWLKECDENKAKLKELLPELADQKVNLTDPNKIEHDLKSPTPATCRNSSEKSDDLKTAGLWNQSNLELVMESVVAGTCDKLPKTDDDKKQFSNNNKSDGSSCDESTKSNLEEVLQSVIESSLANVDTETDCLSDSEAKSVKKKKAFGVSNECSNSSKSSLEEIIQSVVIGSLPETSVEVSYRKKSHKMPKKSGSNISHLEHVLDAVVSDGSRGNRGNVADGNGCKSETCLDNIFRSVVTESTTSLSKCGKRKSESCSKSNLEDVLESVITGESAESRSGEKASKCARISSCCESNSDSSNLEEVMNLVVSGGSCDEMTDNSDIRCAYRENTEQSIHSKKSDHSLLNGNSSFSGERELEISNDVAVKDDSLAALECGKLESEVDGESVMNDLEPPENSNESAKSSTKEESSVDEENKDNEKELQDNELNATVNVEIETFLAAETSTERDTSNNTGDSLNVVHLNGNCENFSQDNSNNSSSSDTVSSVRENSFQCLGESCGVDIRSVEHSISSHIDSSSGDCGVVSSEVINQSHSDSNSDADAIHISASSLTDNVISAPSTEVTESVNLSNMNDISSSNDKSVLQQCSTSSEVTHSREINVHDLADSTSSCQIPDNNIIIDGDTTNPKPDVTNSRQKGNVTSSSECNSSQVDQTNTVQNNVPTSINHSSTAEMKSSSSLDGNFVYSNVSQTVNIPTSSSSVVVYSSLNYCQFDDFSPSQSNRVNEALIVSSPSNKISTNYPRVEDALPRCQDSASPSNLINISSNEDDAVSPSNNVSSNLPYREDAPSPSNNISSNLPNREDAVSPGNNVSSNLPNREDAPSPSNNISSNLPNREDAPSPSNNISSNLPKREDAGTSSNNVLSNSRNKEDAPSPRNHVSSYLPNREDAGSPSNNVSSNLPNREDAGSSSNNVSSYLPNREDAGSPSNNVSSNLLNREDAGSSSNNVSSILPGREDVPSPSNNVSSNLPNREDAGSPSNNVSSNLLNREDAGSSSNNVSSNLPGREDVPSPSNNVSSNLPNREDAGSSSNNVSSYLPNREDAGSPSNNVSSNLPNSEDAGSPSNNVSSNLPGREDVPSPSNNVSSNLPNREDVPSPSNNVSSNLPNREDTGSPSNNVSSNLPNIEDVPSPSNHISSNLPSREDAASPSNQISSNLPSREDAASPSIDVSSNLLNREEAGSPSNNVTSNLPNGEDAGSPSNNISSNLPDRKDAGSPSNNVSSNIPSREDVPSPSNQITSNLPSIEDAASPSNQISSNLPSREDATSPSNNVSSNFPDREDVPSPSNQISSNLPIREDAESTSNQISSNLPNREDAASPSNQISSNLPNREDVPSPCNNVSSNLPNREDAASPSNNVSSNSTSTLPVHDVSSNSHRQEESPFRNRHISDSAIPSSSDAFSGCYDRKTFQSPEISNSLQKLSDFCHVDSSEQHVTSDPCDGVHLTQDSCVTSASAQPGNNISPSNLDDDALVPATSSEARINAAVQDLYPDTPSSNSSVNSDCLVSRTDNISDSACVPLADTQSFNENTVSSLSHSFQSAELPISQNMSLILDGSLKPPSTPSSSDVCSVVDPNLGDNSCIPRSPVMSDFGDNNSQIPDTSSSAFVASSPLMADRMQYVDSPLMPNTPAMSDSSQINDIQIISNSLDLTPNSSNVQILSNISSVSMDSNDSLQISSAVDSITMFDSGCSDNASSDSLNSQHSSEHQDSRPTSSDTVAPSTVLYAQNSLQIEMLNIPDTSTEKNVSSATDSLGVYSNENLNQVESSEEIVQDDIGRSSSSQGKPDNEENTSIEPKLSIPVQDADAVVSSGEDRGECSKTSTSTIIESINSTELVHQCHSLTLADSNSKITCSNSPFNVSQPTPSSQFPSSTQLIETIPNVIDAEHPEVSQTSQITCSSIPSSTDSENLSDGRISTAHERDKELSNKSVLDESSEATSSETPTVENPLVLSTLVPIQVHSPTQELTAENISKNNEEFLQHSSPCQSEDGASLESNEDTEQLTHTKFVEKQDQPKDQSVLQSPALSTNDDNSQHSNHHQSVSELVETSDEPDPMEQIIAQPDLSLEQHHLDFQSSSESKQLELTSEQPFQMDAMKSSSDSKQDNITPEQPCLIVAQSNDSKQLDLSPEHSCQIDAMKSSSDSEQNNTTPEQPCQIVELRSSNDSKEIDVSPEHSCQPQSSSDFLLQEKSKANDLVIVEPCASDLSESPSNSLPSNSQNSNPSETETEIVVLHEEDVKDRDNTTQSQHSVEIDTDNIAPLNSTPSETETDNLSVLEEGAIESKEVDQDNTAQTQNAVEIDNDNMAALNSNPSETETDNLSVLEEGAIESKVVYQGNTAQTQNAVEIDNDNMAALNSNPSETETDNLSVLEEVAIESKEVDQDNTAQTQNAVEIDNDNMAVLNSNPSETTPYKLSLLEEDSKEVDQDNTAQTQHSDKTEDDNPASLNLSPDCDCTVETDTVDLHREEISTEIDEIDSEVDENHDEHREVVLTNEFSLNYDKSSGKVQDNIDLHKAEELPEINETDSKLDENHGKHLEGELTDDEFIFNEEKSSGNVEDDIDQHRAKISLEIKDTHRECDKNHEEELADGDNNSGNVEDDIKSCSMKESSELLEIPDRTPESLIIDDPSEQNEVEMSEVGELASREHSSEFDIVKFYDEKVSNENDSVKDIAKVEAIFVNSNRQHYPGEIEVDSHDLSSICCAQRHLDVENELQNVMSDKIKNAGILLSPVVSQSHYKNATAQHNDIFTVTNSQNDVVTESLNDWTRLEKSSEMMRAAKLDSWLPDDVINSSIDFNTNNDLNDLSSFTSAVSSTNSFYGDNRVRDLNLQTELAGITSTVSCNQNEAILFGGDSQPSPCGSMFSDELSEDSNNADTLSSTIDRIVTVISDNDCSSTDEVNPNIFGLPIVFPKLGPSSTTSVMRGHRQTIMPPRAPGLTRARTCTITRSHPVSLNADFSLGRVTIPTVNQFPTVPRIPGVFSEQTPRGTAELYHAKPTTGFEVTSSTYANCCYDNVPSAHCLPLDSGIGPNNVSSSFEGKLDFHDVNIGVATVPMMNNNVTDTEKSAFELNSSLLRTVSSSSNDNININQFPFL